MGLLSSTDYATTPLSRTLAPGIKRVELGDIRETLRKEGASGPKCKSIINLTLAESSSTTDGDTVAAGFPFVVTIDEWEGREEDARVEQREFALAVLGKARTSKDNVIEAVAAAGGWPALKGKPLLVELGVDKKGFQQVKNYNRVNNGA